MKLILFVIASGITLTQGNAYFQQVGWINPAPSYGHIHMVIDTNLVWNYITKVKEGLGLMRKAVNILPHQDVKRRATTFFEKIELDIDDIVTEFDSFREMIEDIPSNTKRTKRFLGLLVALGSLSLGILNRAELMSLHASVSTIATQQNHIIDILQEHEISIHKVQHNMEIIRAGLEKVITQ